MFGISLFINLLIVQELVSKTLNAFEQNCDNLGKKFERVTITMV